MKFRLLIFLAPLALAACNTTPETRARIVSALEDGVRATCIAKAAADETGLSDTVITDELAEQIVDTVDAAICERLLAE